LTGPLQIAGQIRWKQQIANGQLSISGSNLKMRDLVFKQLSSQCSISNNVIYLNDLTASLNVHDFVGGHGSLNLHAPYHYSGRASTSVSNLSTLQPMLRAFGNQNELAGSLSFDWEGSGDAQTFKNSGKLKLALEKGRYGGLQSLRANIDATYSPDGLDVPIIFFASNKMDFQAIAQAKGQTLELSANLPFDIPKIARARKLPDETAISAKARLPRSSVNFIRELVPEVARLDGDLGLDVDVRGTIAQPVLSGSADMTINVARANNVTLPALNNFKARLNFNGDALTIQQFGGELSGGKFTVTGGVKFPKLTQPMVDLQLKADSALIARNDTLTARANADIKVTGPFASANVAGAIAMTNSHFLKTIDLIPIGLPGRPAPKPPSARPEFSFPEPPFRDWKFD